LVADPVRELNDSVGAKLGSALKGNKPGLGKPGLGKRSLS